MIVTREEMEAARSPRGGWTAATLAKWGVPWPPPKGWRRALLNGDEIPTGELRPIPIKAAKRIAEDYGYDQVIIFARRCHTTPAPHGEHLTTYGRTKEHCAVAAKIGGFLKHKIMGWEKND